MKKTIEVTDRELVLLQDALDDTIAGRDRVPDDLLALQVKLHFLTGESFPPTCDESKASLRRLLEHGSEHWKTR